MKTVRGILPADGFQKTQVGGLNHSRFFQMKDGYEYRRAGPRVANVGAFVTSVREWASGWGAAASTHRGDEA